MVPKSSALAREPIIVAAWCVPQKGSMLYEIHMPQPDRDEPRVEHVYGENWLDALRRALAAAGLPAPTRNLACDLQDDESVVITDTGTGQVFRVLPARDRTARATLGGPRRAHDSVGILRVSTPPADGGRGPTDVTDGHAPSSTLRDLSDPFGEDETASSREEPDPPLEVTAPSMAAPPNLSIGEATVPDGLSELDQLDQRTTGIIRPIGGRSAGPVTPLRGHPMAQAALDDRDRRHRLDALDREMVELEHLGRDIHDACNFTLDAVRAHIPCNAGSVLLIDARDRCLYFAAVRGPKAGVLASQRIPLEVGIAGESIRQRRSLNVRDPANDPRFASSFADAVGYHPRALLCTPVFAGRKAFGVLELLDRDQREAFDAIDQELLALAAHRLGAHFASLLPSG